jgi:hypothetical protein
MNSIMERWVQTCRRELLDRTLIWNRSHLLHALREFEQFYNGQWLLLAIALPLTRALVHRLALTAGRRYPSTRTAKALHQADSAVTADHGRVPEHGAGGAAVRWPKYEREPAGSVADGFEPRIRDLLAAYPSMPASVIADRIGWPYSDRTLRTRVAELRPAYLPPDPASRTSYAAGELAQDDFWFPGITVPVGCGQVRSAKPLPVLTMVCGYSRWASAVLIPSRNAEDLYAGWWQLIGQLGAVPRLLVWDGEGAAAGAAGDRVA